MKNNPDKIKDVDQKGKELDEKRRLLESEIRKLNEKNLRKKTAEGEFKTLGLDNLESDKKRMSEALKEKTVDIKKQDKIVKESKAKLEKIGFNENEYNTIRDGWDKAGDKLYSSLEDLERHRSSVTKASEKIGRAHV